jgi:hypothetical protein
MATPETNPNEYPADAEDVTADRLARYLVQSANYWRKTRQPLVGKLATGSDQDMMIYLAETSAMIAEFATAYLLRYLADGYDGVPPSLANELALQLWNAWEDGGTVHELLWEWATEYGQDPDALPPGTGDGVDTPTHGTGAR